MATNHNDINISNIENNILNFKTSPKRELISIAVLKEHPENTRIYGDHSISDLAEKIKNSNWIKSLVINSKNTIISGHRRYHAAKSLGYKEIPCEIVNFKDELEELEQLLLENEYRERTKEQKIREAEVWERIESERAKSRMLAGKKPESNPVANLPQGKTRDNVAKKVGLGSGKNYESAKKVVKKIDEYKEQGKEHEAKALSKALEASTSGAEKLVDNNVLEKAEPVQVEELEKGNLSANQLYTQVIKEDKNQAHVEKIVEKPKGNTSLLKTVKRKYPLILADIPWQYNDGRNCLDDHSRTMSFEDICELPVKEIADSDCILFLWSTPQKLTEAMEVIKAWGFTYRTCMCWDKREFGQLSRIRSQFGLLLIATKGSVPAHLLGNIDSELYTNKRIGRTKKPDYFYKQIERIFPEYAKIELFAKKRREGWDKGGKVK